MTPPVKNFKYDWVNDLYAERNRLVARVGELGGALEVCEREMSEAYRLGLVDSLAPKFEASSFTQAVFVARAVLKAHGPAKEGGI